MYKLIIFAKTLFRLGLINVIYVFCYRISTGFQLNKILFRQRSIQTNGMMFYSGSLKSDDLIKWKGPIINEAEKIIKGQINYYGFHRKNLGKIPDWFFNPFNSTRYRNYHKHWLKLTDFDQDTGDIKNIWEASRFNWIVLLAGAYSLTHEIKYLNTLNDWARDWLEKNPMNTGPNWKCGQEASIRAINALLAFEILGTNEMSSGLFEFVRVHIERIRSTTYYAKSQANNHGISEGAALYILGYYLWKNSASKKDLSLLKKGINLLENRVNKLFLNDGSFSQQSIVYHRMVMDLLSIVEAFRQKWKMNPFSKSFYLRVKMAVQWYSTIVEPLSGQAPNIGANDGTLLFNIALTGYRDFRPSLTLAASVFKVRINNHHKVLHPLLDVFNIQEIEGDFLPFKSTLISGGEYAKLVRQNGFALLRLPVYTFRPSHSDALHLDIWQNGINWIRDAGSFSYFLTDNEQDKFSGTEGHSTIQFDGRNQMPRISRFLFGEWLKPSHLDFNPIENSIDSGYIDFNNAQHRRKVSTYQNGWEIIDTIGGSFEKAVQRWILAPGSWYVQDYSIRNGNISISISSEKILRFELVDGKESLYYMDKTSVPILEVEFQQQCIISTKIIFSI